jgi:hypothetical protein
VVEIAPHERRKDEMIFVFDEEVEHTSVAAKISTFSKLVSYPSFF